MPLEAIAAGGAPVAGERLVAMERLLTMLPAVVVSDLGAKRASHGSALRPEDLAMAARNAGGVSSDESAASSLDRRLRLLDQAGSLLGLAERRADGLLHPVVVLV